MKEQVVLLMRDGGWYPDAHHELISTDKYLKFKEIGYFNLSLKCDQPYFIYVNSLYFQQWNSDWNIAFFILSLNSKLGFLNVGLRFFPISQKNWKLGFASVALAELHNFF